MPKATTFAIGRGELRKALVASGVSDKSMTSIFSAMDKAHRHMNAIAFASLLEKSGLDRDRITNILRRLGMDDMMVSGIFNMVDEQRISAETGRLYHATIDFS